MKPARTALSPPDPPRVTVAIPVFNRESYLGEAIESILAQGFGDYELLILDDGSTDRSQEVALSYEDPRVRLVRNGRNLGIPRTRNRALELARGQYLAWLDSDDRALPDRLEREVAFLDANPAVAAVGAWTGAIDEAGRRLKRVRTVPTAPGEVWAQLLLRCCLLQYTVMGRTEVLRQYGFRESFPVSQDFDLFVRMGERHRLANLPRVLARRRLHGGRVTRERGALVKAKNIEILAHQLSALGVEATENDLEGHFTLSRLGKLGVRPDAPYLDWAEAWLRRLEDANRRSLRYGQRDLMVVTGKAWLQAWLHASPDGRRGRWGRLLHGPLRASVLLGLRSWLREALPELAARGPEAVLGSAATKRGH